MKDQTEEQTQEQFPESYMTEEQMVFLDNLRESGVTNMFGASTYVAEHFPELTECEARKVTAQWMQTFSKRHPEGGK